MKNSFIIMFVLAGFMTTAQVSRVSLRASGLTCSMCSNAIYKSLKAIDFIDQVKTDLTTYTFEISFKQTGLVNFDRIRARVESAGFSVADFTADINVAGITTGNDHTIIIGVTRLILSGPVDHPLEGIVTVRFIDKGFVLPKEYRANEALISRAADQVYHVVLR